MTAEQEFEDRREIDCQKAWRFALDYFGRYVTGVSTEEVKAENEELWWGVISHMVSCSDPICEEINGILHVDKYLDGEQMRQYFGEQVLELQKQISERISPNAS